MDGSMRASHDDRRRAAEVLRYHAIQGRLTLKDLSTRLESVKGAVTHADLTATVADLPADSASGWNQWIVATGLLVAAALIAGVALGISAMVAMMAFMGPATG